jgi:NTE family protein
MYRAVLQEPIRRVRADKAYVAPKRVTKTINLALQGGGAHGAFTWGVIDRLLEDGRLDFDGIVATSAGAMNAAVLACGLAEGGLDGARTALTNFWRRVSHAGIWSPLQPTVFDRLMQNQTTESSPAFLAFDMMTRLLSPYQFNPFNLNPLRMVLEKSVDFDVIRAAHCPIKLFLCATNVRSGKVKIFDNSEVSIDAVMASACLPFLFQAVEIGGEAYWDGGYMGNPAIFPLIYNCDSRNVLVININPIRRDEIPRTATGILNRINEISFNSSLMREMRAIAFVTDLIDQDKALSAKLKKIHIHSIAPTKSRPTSMSRASSMSTGNSYRSCATSAATTLAVGSRRISSGSAANRPSMFAPSFSNPRLQAGPCL